MSIEIIVAGLFILCAIVALCISIGLICTGIWYRWKYIDSRSWEKCYVCGKAEPTMYIIKTFWGRKALCFEHSKREE